MILNLLENAFKYGRRSSTSAIWSATVRNRPQPPSRRTCPFRTWKRCSPRWKIIRILNPLLKTRMTFSSISATCPRRIPRKSDAAGLGGSTLLPLGARLGRRLDFSRGLEKEARFPVAHPNAATHRLAGAAQANIMEEPYGSRFRQCRQNRAGSAGQRHDHEPDCGTVRRL